MNPRTPIRASLEKLALNFAEGLLRAVSGAPLADVGELDASPGLAHRSSPGQANDPLAKLTARERDVFERVLRGSSNSDMARALGISVKTVQTHRAKVNRKLGVRSPADLVRFGALHGLLRPGDNGGADRTRLPEDDTGAPFPIFNLAEMERRTIAAALRVTKGNRERAALLLGIPRSTLDTKLRSSAPTPAVQRNAAEEHRGSALTGRMKKRFRRSAPYRRNAAQLATELAPLNGPEFGHGGRRGRR